MAPCSACCAPTVKNQKGWSIATGIAACVVLIAAWWMTVAANDSKDTVMCVVDNFDVILHTPVPPGADSDTLEDAKKVSEDARNVMHKFSGLFILGLVLPGWIFFGLLIFTVLFSVLAFTNRDGKFWPQTSKACNCLSIFFALAAFVFFVVGAVAGISFGMPQVQSQ